MKDLTYLYNFKTLRIVRRDGKTTTISVRFDDYTKLNTAAIARGFKGAADVARKQVLLIDDSKQTSTQLRKLTADFLGVSLGKYHGKAA